NGIGIGFVTWVLLRTACGRARDVHPLRWVVAAGFVVYFVRGPLTAVVGGGASARPLGRRATRSSGWPVGAGGARRADERTRHGRERTRERRRAPRGRRGAARAARGGGPTAGAHRRRRARRRARPGPRRGPRGPRARPAVPQLPDGRVRGPGRRR